MSESRVEYKAGIENLSSNSMPDSSMPPRQKFRAISIQRKIIVGSISLILFLAVSMIIIMTEMSKIETSATSVINVRQPIAVQFLRFSDDLNLATTFLNGYLLTGNLDNKTGFIELSELLKLEMERFHDFAKADDSIIDKEKISEFDKNMLHFFSYSEKLFLLRNNVLDNYPGLRLASKELMPAANAYLSSANLLMDDLLDSQTTKENYQLMGLLAEVRFSWQQIMNTLRLFMNSRNQENVENLELYIEENRRLFDRLKKMPTNIGFNLIEDMDFHANHWRNNWREVVKIYSSDAWRRDSYLMKTEVRPIVEKLRSILLDLSNAQVHASKQDGIDLTESLGTVRVYSNALLLISLALCIVLAITISRSVIPPIKSLMNAAQRIAAGDLDITVPVIKQDEMGDLSMSFNKMIDDLRKAEKEKQNHLHQVKQWNQDLENRVQEKVTELKSAQGQLLQSEKLASIGQLAAGVAHEINNPVGYISSNVGTLKNYIENLFRVLDAYEQLEQLVGASSNLDNIIAVKKEVEIDYLKQDIAELIAESQEGITRVKQIVQDLKDFSHVDEAEWQWVDIHKGIDSTLNVAHNETKYKAEVIKEYGDIPRIQCMPSQINQVFMNLVVNAAHAIEERGVITIRSGHTEETVWVSVSDNGKGIPEDVQKRIFEPFFTTKPVGKGTGLGLSLSYGIIEKHNGVITVESEPGVGTTFKVELPINHEDKGDSESKTAVESAA